MESHLKLRWLVLLIFNFIQRLDFLYEMAFNIDLDFHDVNFNMLTKKSLIRQKQMNHILYLTKWQIFCVSSIGRTLKLIHKELT